MRWNCDTELETEMGVGAGTELEIEMEIEKQKKEPEWGWRWGLGNLCIKITEVIIGIKGGIIAIMTMIIIMTDYEYVGLFLNLGCVNERVAA